MATKELEIPVERALPSRKLDALQRRVRRQPLAIEMLEALAEASAVVDKEGHILVANRRMSALAGTPADSLVGRRFGEAVRCDNVEGSQSRCSTTTACGLCGVGHTLAAALEKGRSATGDWHILHHGDLGLESLDHRVTVTPLSLEGMELFVASLRDISDERRRRMLERSFFHDVLNLASGLHGLGALLEEASPEELPELAGDLRETVDQLLGEVRAQRDLVAAERGELVPNLEVVDARTLLRRIAARFRRHPAAQDRRIELGEFPSARFVVTDKTLLTRVLGNLLLNALEATSPGEAVSLGLCVGRRVTFLVWNPATMPEEVRLQLFRRVFSTKSPQSRGLGTYGARLLTERYLGGTIDFSTDEEAGTTFRVHLPRRRLAP